VILLDTSVLSRAFRRKAPGAAERRVRAAVEALFGGDADLGLPGIVLQEVLSGLRSEKQFSELQHRLVSAFSIVHPTTDDHVEAVRLKNRCLAKGFSPSGTDCLIASMTIARGHELFAMDDDFEAIARHAPLKLHRPPNTSSS
jgi:predicted nucleic acid-binding protein